MHRLLASVASRLIVQGGERGGLFGNFMAVLDSNARGWIVCHETFVRNVYRKTKREGKYVSLEFDPILFDILEPFKEKKRVREELFDAEIRAVKEAYEGLVELYGNGRGEERETNDGNLRARLLADDFYNRSANNSNPFLGGNKGDEAMVAAVGGEEYVFPEKCAFYSHDIKDIDRHLGGSSFHFVLMDPPWWNKYIRRKRKANAKSGYSMLYDADLLGIPVNSLLEDDGIVGVWCTSAPSHIDAVTNVLFPAWNVDFVSQWFWLKVTKRGKPVCAFSPTLGKQPYERVIFGTKRNAARKQPNPENDKLVMSVPSAIHSHKPPLCELIRPYIPENGKCLELFARYLLPDWTSYGNEVLKLQNLALYSEIPLPDLSPAKNFPKR